MAAHFPPLEYSKDGVFKFKYASSPDIIDRLKNDYKMLECSVTTKIMMMPVLGTVSDSSETDAESEDEDTMRNDGCYKYFITGKGFRKFNYTIPKG
jgi:hypothetical protein